MDDPTIGLSVPLKLQRACVCSRLEKQFLITAYECLVPIMERVDSSTNGDDRWDALPCPAARKRTRPLEATAGRGT